MMNGNFEQVMVEKIIKKVHTFTKTEFNVPANIFWFCQTFVAIVGFYAKLSIFMVNEVLIDVWGWSTKTMLELNFIVWKNKKIYTILNFSTSPANICNKNAIKSCEMCSELTNKVTWAQFLKKDNPKKRFNLKDTLKACIW